VSGDPIDDYLDRLRAGLRTPPARTAEIVAEAEDHLRESAAVAGQRAQLSEAEAQRAAIAAFGPARRVVRAHRPTAAEFAVAAAMKAWPVLGCYLLLTSLIGWILYASSTPMREKPVAWMPRLPSALEYGGGMLLGAALVAGFLVVRGRRRRSGAGSARLPRGLVSWGAVITPLALGIAGYEKLIEHPLVQAQQVLAIVMESVLAGGLLVVGGAAWTLVCLLRLAVAGLRTVATARLSRDR
jgi:hypothetical protein